MTRARLSHPVPQTAAIPGDAWDGASGTVIRPEK